MNQACDHLTRNLTLREWRRYLGDSEPYRKTCPNLPYPPDYEEAQETNNNLSSLSTWLTGKINNLISLQP
ncbi:MAG: hypothetical protein AAFN40_11985 [Cyanobacteria bacterium J06560_6]